MQEIISSRIEELGNEMNSLHQEQIQINNRMRDIDIRMHQIMGAIYELQSLIMHPDCQSSDSGSCYDCSGHCHPQETESPSASYDQDTHQEQRVETEKNSQPQS
jgi:hypothetical protein